MRRRLSGAGAREQVGFLPRACVGASWDAWEVILTTVLMKKPRILKKLPATGGPGFVFLAFGCIDWQRYGERR